jgi:hypothetical protein
LHRLLQLVSKLCDRTAAIQKTLCALEDEEVENLRALANRASRAESQCHGMIL